MTFLHSKFHIITTYLLSTYLLFISFEAFSNGKKKCGDSCFSSEVISVEQEENCYLYEVEVSFSGSCSFELSHFNLDFGCGTISEASNSAGWPMELNTTDPTTGLNGLKVDDIHGFGKNANFKKFTVYFKFCPDEKCTEDAGCLSPQAAYKAGQCVYYEDLEASCSEPLLVETATTEPTCYNSMDGSITLNISGGRSPYSILWDNGYTDSLLADLSGGTYGFKVTDAAGEVFESDVVLNSPEELKIAATITNPPCSNVNTGSITLQLSGGVGSYIFLWNNGSTVKDVNGLSEGNYTVTVSDENGCTATGSYDLSALNSLNVVPQIVQPSCGVNPTGSIELTASGGSGPYQFAWSDGDSTQNRYNLSDGYYSITITDQLGCQINKTYSIRTQTTISTSTKVTHSNCYNDPIGAVDLYVAGGTEPYTFQWSNGAVTEDLSNISAGKYSVLITDAKGCQLTLNANVYQQNLQTFAWATKTPSCPGSEDATVDGMVFFGTAPLTYSWSNGDTTEDLTNIGAGIYNLTVTDAIGCSGSATVTVNDPTPAVISYEVIPEGCADSVSYDILVNVAGGSGTYTYEWSNGETTEYLYDQPGGSYILLVTDGNGCTSSQEIIADGYPGSTACIINELDSVPVCGSTGNLLTSSISGAVSYLWSVVSSDGQWQITSATDGSAIEFTTGAEASSATFTLEVLLETGCIATCTYSVSVCDGENSTEDPDNGSEDPDNSDDPNNPDNPDDGSDSGSGDSDGSDNGNGSGNNGDGSGDDGSGSDTGDGAGDNADDNDGSDNSCEDCDNHDGDDNGDSDGDDSSDHDDGDKGDDNNDSCDQEKSCDECFFTSPVEITKNGDLLEYSIIVNHDNNCNYELSHFTVAIPECAVIMDFSNSMNWPMEVINSDPTTGISGIKVDNISSFGKKEIFSSFEISIVLQSGDAHCSESLSCYLPEVAYKAATCVYYEQTEGECPQPTEDFVDHVQAYPNPTCNKVKVKLSGDNSEDHYKIDLMDFQGRIVYSKQIKGTSKELTLDLTAFKSELFFLKVTGSGGSQETIRILKN